MIGMLIIYVHNNKNILINIPNHVILVQIMIMVVYNIAQIHFLNVIIIALHAKIPLIIV